MNKYVSLFLFSLGVAILLILFSLIPDFTRYIFSLASIYLGFRFFQRYESIRFRVVFILISIVLFLILMVIFSMMAVMMEWDIPGITDV